MKTVRIAANFSGLNASERQVNGEHIYQSMVVNPNFPNPYPNLGLLQNANANLQTALVNEKPGDKESTSLVHDWVREQNRIIKALAAYVEFESNNDATIALSSGFSIKEASVPSPKNFNAKQGKQSGTVELETKASRNSSYIWQYAASAEDNANWQQAGVSLQSSFMVSGITPALKYWFRVAVVTKKGQQPFSDPYGVLVV